MPSKKTLPNKPLAVVREAAETNDKIEELVVMAVENGAGGLDAIDIALRAKDAVSELAKMPIFPKGSE